MFNKVKSVFRSVKSSLIKAALAVCGAVGAAAVTASPSHAAITVDYSGITTGLETQFGAALSAALPFMGIVMGIYLGVRAYRRFAK